MPATVIVITADQRRSTRRPDRVPQALRALGTDSFLRAPERTAGDELQGVLGTASPLPDVLATLLRDGGWTVGLGFGEVEGALPASARAGRGPAYVHARSAVSRAKRTPLRLAVDGADPGTRDLETVLWLWAGLLARRSEPGWQVADLNREGLSNREIAARLGVSESAISQRARAAAVLEDARGRELIVRSAAALLGQG